MDRKTYWNEKYVDYWRARVAESNQSGGVSKVIANDAKTEGDAVYEDVFRRLPFQPGSILDVGCAWGRMFGMFRAHGLAVSGVDISDAMIEQCREKWADTEGIEHIEVAEAEALPFADASFDNLTCLAVFDATYQHRALGEFLRVLRPDGMLYLTGKNTFYALDDQLAHDAEIGARSRGHPNYFTDVASMLEQLTARGHILVGTWYFRRRGDFAGLSFVETMPDAFYEYLLILRKDGDDDRPLVPLSDACSRTFRVRSAEN